MGPDVLLPHLLVLFAWAHYDVKSVQHSCSGDFFCYGIPDFFQVRQDGG